MTQIGFLACAIIFTLLTETNIKFVLYGTNRKVLSNQMEEFHGDLEVILGHEKGKYVLRFSSFSVSSSSICALS